MDIKLALMTGVNIPIPECQLILHQPQVKEISMLGEETYFTGVQCLCLEKKALDLSNSELSNTPIFKIFMAVMMDKEGLSKKIMTSNLLKILFPDYNIIFTPLSIIFRKDDEQFVVDEANFEALQNILKLIFKWKSLKEDSFNPANEEAKRIADKLMAGRAKVAKEKGDNNGSVFGTMVSTLAVGLHISITELASYTVFQIQDLYERFKLYLAYDLDTKVRLAGGTPQSEPESWLKNLY